MPTAEVRRNERTHLALHALVTGGCFEATDGDAPDDDTQQVRFSPTEPLAGDHLLRTLQHLHADLAEHALDEGEPPEEGVAACVQLGCPGRPQHEAWAVGEPLLSGFRLGPEGCVANADPGSSWYRATPMGSDAFVLADAVPVSGDGVHRLVLRTDDGEAQWVGPFDSARDELCVPLPAPTELACATLNAAGVAPALHTDPGSGAEPVAIRYSFSDACPSPAIVVSGPVLNGVGSEVPAKELYSSAGGTCVPFDPPQSGGLGGRTFYGETTPVATADLPAAQILAPGSTQLAVRTIADVSGWEVALTGTPRLQDTELGFDCDAYATQAGTLVCAPTRLTPFPFFEDSSCEVPLITVPVPGPESGWVSLVTFGLECGEATIVAVVGRVGAAFDGPVFDLSTGCTPLPDPKNFADFATLESPLSVDELMPVERIQL